jgi:hypothetical protein
MTYEGGMDETYMIYLREVKEELLDELINHSGCRHHGDGRLRSPASNEDLGFGQGIRHESSFWGLGRDE